MKNLAVIILMLTLFPFTVLAAQGLNGELFEDLMKQYPDGQSILFKTQYNNLMTKIKTGTVSFIDVSTGSDGVSRLFVDLKKTYPEFIKNYPFEKYPVVFLPRIAWEFNLQDFKNLLPNDRLKGDLPELLKVILDTAEDPSLRQDILSRQAIIDRTIENMYISSYAFWQSKGFHNVFKLSPEIQEFTFSLVKQHLSEVPINSILIEHDKNYKAINLFFDLEFNNQYMEILKNRLVSEIKNQSLIQEYMSIISERLRLHSKSIILIKKRSQLYSELAKGTKTLEEVKLEEELIKKEDKIIVESLKRINENAILVGNTCSLFFLSFSPPFKS